nr:zinc finger protein 287-like [Anolis sagrei ordinatus]
MEKSYPKVTEPRGRLENGEREADIVQAGPMKDFLKRDVPLQVKKETVEQRWETQLQEFLKTMDPPHSGGRPPQFLEPMFEEDTKESQASIKEITNQWPRREWAPRPPSWASEDLLRGASQPNGGLDSSMNMEKLPSEDAVSSEVRRQRFRLFCYEAAKGPREVCKQLWKLCHQWLKPESCSTDQFLDVLIMEQFLSVLPSEMQSWVMEGSPENCSQAVDMAEDFLQRLKEPEKWAKEVKKETEEQRWETQLQEFLKTMDPPHSGGRPPQFLEDTKESQTSIREIANLWPRREWAPRPPSWASEDLLKGVNQPNRCLDSSINMEKLLNEDAVSSEVRHQRFRLFCYEAAKGPREVCKQLWKLCHQWLKPERCSKDQILEVLILEQFLTVLPSEMQSWVMERIPENCSQAVDMAEEFLQRLEEPEKWAKEEPEMVLESFVSITKSEQEPLDPIQTQLPVEAKQEGDDESNFLDNGQVQESEEESSHLQKHDQVPICGISLQSLETDLMHGNPPVPEACSGNHPVEENKHEEDPSLQSNSFSEEINHFKIKKEQTDNKNVKDLNSQVEEGAEKPHKCFYCGKTSNCKADLVVHERIHTGEKPYTCLDCGKCFNRKSTLVRHQRMHTGEKPYECAVCGWRFSARCNLINHERIHTGEKPYSCSNCGQSFSRRMQFVVHNRTHTGETPYRCIQCGKCFTRRSSLLTHERNHTGKKTNIVASQAPDELSECSEDEDNRLQPVISEESAEDSRGLERDVLESPGRSQATGKSDISSHETRPEWALEENVGDEGFSKSSRLEIRTQNVKQRQDNERESRCAQSDVMGGIEAF